MEGIIQNQNKKDNFQILGIKKKKEKERTVGLMDEAKAKGEVCSKH